MTPRITQELRRPARRRGCSLDELSRALEGLVGDPEAHVRGARVAELLRRYAASEESWRPFVTFRDAGYSRNLVWRCEGFELLLLCWDEGQESPIHDHAGQHCWMAVLEGELEEAHFAEPAGDGAPEERRVQRFGAGSVGYIRDDIALHQIRPVPGSGAAVSLHLYAGPIDRCRTYCDRTGEAEVVEVGYDSVRGVDCDGEDPDRIREAWGEG